MADRQQRSVVRLSAQSNKREGFGQQCAIQYFPCGLKNFRLRGCLALSPYYDPWRHDHVLRFQRPSPCIKPTRLLPEFVGLGRVFQPDGSHPSDFGQKKRGMPPRRREHPSSTILTAEEIP